ncbi:MAG: glycosyltransferase, partial [Polyangiaceae bacterium]
YESIVIDVTFVVPCYNEEKRIDEPRFAELARGAHLIFVDDGSKDGTRAVLDAFARRTGDRVEVISLEKNSGKAEAVRRGMLMAAERGDRIVGFADADLATPPREILRIGKTIDEQKVAVVLGARVALIGKRIERNPARHYLGRVFATIATKVIRAPFYDTQCGAKAFLNTPSLRAALAEPFLTRWIFDLEILGRLLVGDATAPAVPLSDFYELPLEEWVDVRGSKIGLDMAARVWIDLGRIARDLERRRKNSPQEGK